MSGADRDPAGLTDIAVDLDIISRATQDCADVLRLATTHPRYLRAAACLERAALETAAAARLLR